ncbi:ABC transporter permease [Amycolatopsis viridis]|uniref:Simple sugar transport system permease protein/ribose transport system permease protein n=1 Tax=Amycolatopsis viridis TaxID=185678 RepID=A0ABX0T0K2_9PSEU|nr:ABC transporter permease [Amycolatopsis viridis]NIH82258.1 simple sugar transport system permease protein/ribose transport system permease protein [Amycolatopsis viridis]
MTVPHGNLAEPDTEPAPATPGPAGVRSARAAGTGGTKAPRWVPNKRNLPVVVIVVIAVAVLVAGALATPAFLTTENILNIVRAASVVGIAALGMTFITMSGNYFSMSVEQTAAFTAVSFAMLMNTGMGWLLSVVCALLLAAVVGIAQGLVVAAGANPIITTLGAGAALFGLASVMTDQKQVNIQDNTALFIGTGRPLGVPVQTWALVLLTVVFSVVLIRTRTGRQMTLVGANRHAAKASGLNVKLASLTAFTISGVAAGLAGVFAAAQTSRGIVNQFPDFNTEVIAAVLVGGTLVQGGRGSMWQTCLGAIFIAMVSNLLALRGYSFGVRITVEGVAVAIAVSTYALARRRSA